MKSVLVLCDPVWSTGAMARDLASLLPQYAFTLHDWTTTPIELLPSYDVVCCMTITGAARIPALRDAPNAVHVCLHPNELALPEVRELATTRRPLRIGAVSRECESLVRTAFPDQTVTYTPLAIWMQRFSRRSPRRVRRAGFVGFSQAELVEVTGATKRPEMFTAICADSELSPVYSGKRFTYTSMQEFYDSIDVLICTSSIDGGPLPPLEAISAGVPALSTDVGCVHDYELPGRFNTVAEAVAILRDIGGLADAQYQLLTNVHGGQYKAPLWANLFERV